MPTEIDAPNGICLTIDEESALLELLEHSRHCARMRKRQKATYACRLEHATMHVVARLKRRELIESVLGGFRITERGILAMHVPPGPVFVSGATR